MQLATTGRLARAARPAVTLAIALSLGACAGSSPRPASRPSPPPAIDLSVLIAPSRILIAPPRLGAGPVVLIVTNQSPAAQSLTVRAADGTTLAVTAPISPRGTTKLSADLPTGSYTVGAQSGGATDAESTLPPRIRPARLAVGAERASGDNRLLLP